MHHSAPTSSAVGFPPAMYSFSGPTSHPEFDLGPPCTSDHLQRATLSNKYVAEDFIIAHFFHTFVSNALILNTSVALSHYSWETRCLRKNRKRADYE